MANGVYDDDQARTAGMAGRMVARLDNSAMARWVYRMVAALLLTIGGMGLFIVSEQLKADAQRSTRIEAGVESLKTKFTAQSQTLNQIQINTAVQDQRIERAFDRLGEQDRRINKIENKVFP